MERNNFAIRSLILCAVCAVAFVLCGCDGGSTKVIMPEPNGSGASSTGDGGLQDTTSGSTSVSVTTPDINITTPPNETDVEVNTGDTASDSTEYSGPEAKYVILVIGDGMQLEHEIAASQYLTGYPDALSFHRFPYQSYMTTWDETTYGRYAWQRGEEEYNESSFMPGLAYDVFSGGPAPYPIVPDLDSTDDYFLQRAVCYGETDLDLDDYYVDGNTDNFPRFSDNTDSAYPYYGGVSSSLYKLKFYMCTDSAAAGTAMATGKKVEAGNISWKSAGRDGFFWGKSEYDNDPNNAQIKTICEMVRDEKGAFFGTVSSVPYNHATPATFISHNPDRNNYYSGRRSWYDGQGLCEDIFYNVRPDVVIGGGAPTLQATAPTFSSGYVSEDVYKDLVGGKTEYVLAAPNETGGGTYTAPTYNTIDSAVAAIIAGGTTQKKLCALYASSNWTGPYAKDSDDGTVGIYRDSDLTTAIDTSTDPLTQNDPMDGSIPRLDHATVSAMKLLLWKSANADDKGFFLMSEQGDIDWANHANDYAWMVGTTWELHKTIDSIVRFVDADDSAFTGAAQDKMNWSNTLLIATSDHGNSYMRLKRDSGGDVALGKGELPTQTATGAGTGSGQHPYQGNFTYSDEVTYGSDYHTNELVMVYARGAGTAALSNFEGLWYPGTRILDNTQLFRAMAKALYLEDYEQ